MARWALWMVIVTGIQVLLSGAGIWLVWQTLKATRDAVEEARDATRSANDAVAITELAAKQQLKAYLLPSSAQLAAVAPDETTFIIGLRNYGQTPAYGVTSEVGFTVAHRDEEDFELLTPWVRKLGVIGPSGTNDLIIRAGINEEHYGTLSFIRGERAVFIYGMIHYHDAFDQRRSSSFRYRVNAMDSKPGAKLIACDGGMVAT